MNNMQYVVKDDTRYAMHVAVELCEQGDFDSVTDAFRWLMQERDDSELGNGILYGREQIEALEAKWKAEGETCRLHYGEDDDGYDGWYCDECGGWFQVVRRDGHLVKPKHCQECGRKATR